MSKWIPGDSRRRLHTALEKSRTFESNLKEAQLVLISRNATVAIKGALHWDWESKLQPSPMLTPVFWFLAWSHFHVTSTFRATVNCDPTAVATNGPVFKLLTTKLLNYSDFITKKPENSLLCQWMALNVTHWTSKSLFFQLLLAPTSEEMSTFWKSSACQKNPASKSYKIYP